MKCCSRIHNTVDWWWPQILKITYYVNKWYSFLFLLIFLWLINVNSLCYNFSGFQLVLEYPFKLALMPFSWCLFMPMLIYIYWSKHMWERPTRWTLFLNKLFQLIILDMFRTNNYSSSGGLQAAYSVLPCILMYQCINHIVSATRLLINMHGQIL